MAGLNDDRWSTVSTWIVRLQYDKRSMFFYFDLFFGQIGRGCVVVWFRFNFFVFLLFGSGQWKPSAGQMFVFHRPNYKEKGKADVLNCKWPKCRPSSGARWRRGRSFHRLALLLFESLIRQTERQLNKNKNNKEHTHTHTLKHTQSERAKQSNR